MNHVEHIVGIIPTIICIDNNVARFLLNATCGLEKRRERHSGPLRDGRPALFADMHCGLRSRRKAFQVLQ